MKKGLLLIMILYAFAVQGAGPEKIGKTDRSLWPYPVNTPAGFDFASKMEMLVFAGSIREMDKMEAAQLKEFLGMNNISIKSVETYSATIKQILLRNFQHLNHTHPNDFIPDNSSTWDGILSMIDYQKTNLPEVYRPWYENAVAFYMTYAYEQYRLAALFERVTSEILKLEDSEYNGTELADKTFILTFDDGPTPKGGNTDKLIKVLRSLDKKAIFFILDTSLKSRSDNNIKDLYEGMATASHGKTHKPHTSPEIYEGLAAFSKSMAELSGLEMPCYFRPPYGQRTVDLINYLGESGCRIVLWNIDSQDWSANINETELLDRLVTLSLVWRSGILLFHDVHNKSLKILPEYFKIMDGAGVKFTVNFED